MSDQKLRTASSPDPSSAAADAPRRGRPVGSTRVDEPRAAVATWLPASAHERLIKLANEQEQSISATVRSILILTLR